MIYKLLVCSLLAAYFSSVLHAQNTNDVSENRYQVITDSLTEDFRSIMTRNFSRYRTVNLYWEMKPAHDYTLTAGGKEIEKGRKCDLHTIRFSTMVPVLKKRQFSLYANLQYAGYVFDTEYVRSIIFYGHSYNMYSGGFCASYLSTLFNRPLVLSADVSVDGSDSGWGMVQGRFVAAIVIARNRCSGMTLGVAGMTLGKVPVLPVISYWKRFSNPNLSIDITLPSQLYIRYQHNVQRISAGCSISGESFYLHSTLPDTPATCYYSEAVLKPDILYEYIINNHFYLSARAGISTVIKGAIYTKSRKELNTEIRQKRSLTPYFSVGVSYSLFK